MGTQFDLKGAERPRDGGRPADAAVRSPTSPGQGTQDTTETTIRSGDTVVEFRPVPSPELNGLCHPGRDTTRGMPTEERATTAVAPELPGTPPGATPDSRRTSALRVAGNIAGGGMNFIDNVALTISAGLQLDGKTIGRCFFNPLGRNEPTFATENVLGPAQHWPENFRAPPSSPGGSAATCGLHLLGAVGDGIKALGSVVELAGKLCKGFGLLSLVNGTENAKKDFFDTIGAVGALGRNVFGATLYHGWGIVVNALDFFASLRSL